MAESEVSSISPDMAGLLYTESITVLTLLFSNELLFPLHLSMADISFSALCVGHSLVPSPSHPSFYLAAVEKKRGEGLVPLITCRDI